MKRNLIFIGIILLISIVVYGIFQYNKPHRDIASEKSSYDLSADDLYKEFEQDVDKASMQYADKVITFAGTISNVEQNQNGGYNILLKGEKGVINCEVDAAPDLDKKKLSANSHVKIKGLCVGFDDLLQELQFKKCHIVQ
ncbi:hypothetical protein QQ020_19860 [Fulvivirgaceae bacterium BMA12]|uniref:tRNA_anti-like n=1 Tax=Agaribacillus aureus TaxID=3051825 RepID=A0ABT8L9A7_9BACT|nr:hypothetical protein [Fulvivirgaceae bacterium BMA12]